MSLPRPKRTSTAPPPTVAPEDTLYTDIDRSGDTLDVPLSALCPNPFSKRKKKGVAELAATIEEVGLLQNIAHIRREVWLKVYPETEEAITAPNVILFGEHRWLAFKELERATIPSVLRDDLVDDALLITLIENLRRAQLSPLEEAEHYQTLRDAGLSYEQIADRVGETANGATSKGTVWKRVKLLSLAPAIKQALEDGTLKISAAEKAQPLDHADQTRYLNLVLGGTRPAQAYSQVLAHEQPKGEAEGEASESSVSSGNAAAHSGPPAPRASAEGGNGGASPPKDRKSGRARAKDDEHANDRRSAAAAREVACRVIVGYTDVSNPANTKLVMSVLAAAVLTPSNQSAAQQRAFTWLQKTRGKEGEAQSYFAAIHDSPDPVEQRLAAFAVALATTELRMASRRQAWGPRERNYVRLLQTYGDYQPATEWEAAQLGLETAGGTT
ncbi:ParB/RepB/Spo0J family partition protein [Streptomyces albidoflavus]|uniref:ParB/RepB/Spo0J family partition protein n=1 Tax=Streptomyces albidoflavus TaxID=1886 RepID=UPI00188D054C|nr:ParB N-terminal domain-containing protein [Streptomyces albidoflavus]MBF4138140.1 ParB N-terminal domain-containing protein [Streptomyces albidoflavus]